MLFSLIAAEVILDQLLRYGNYEVLLFNPRFNG